MAKKVTQKPTAKAIPKAVVKNNTPATEIKKSWSPVTKYALFLGVLAFCVYANTLQNGYVYDDAFAIQNNALVKKGIASIPEILSSPYLYTSFKIKENKPISGLYRPLSLIMFATEYQLFQDNPMPGHFMNILLYAGCVIVFFLFLYHLFRKKRPLIAFIAALLFALHPIHTEVVANLKSRDELLCFFFGILALNTFIKYLDANKIQLLIIGFIFYFLSLLSKETSITLLAVIPIIFFLYRNENKKQSIYILLLSFLPALVFLAIRFSVLTTHNANNIYGIDFMDNALVGAPSFAIRSATIMLVLGYYIKLLIIPLPLICDYSFNAIPFANFSNIGVWLSLVTYALLIYFGILRLVKKRNDPVAFGIFFFLITISIFSNIVFLIGSEMAERFLFFPSVGFCILVAFIIEHIVFKSEISDFTVIINKKVLVILVPISIIFIGITLSRNNDWKDNLTLFTTDSRKSPNNARLYYFAGNQEYPLGIKGTDPAIFHEAIINFQKSIAIYPDNGKVQNKLAMAFLKMKQFDSAEVHSKKAALISPDDDNLLNSLANVYMAQQKYAEAFQLLQQASLLDSTNPYYPGNIGLINIYTKHFDSAIYYFRKSLSLDQACVISLDLISFTFNITYQKDSALKYEYLARQVQPGFRLDKFHLPFCGFCR